MKIIALLDVDNDAMRERWGNDLAELFNALNEALDDSGEFGRVPSRYGLTPVASVEQLDLDRLIKFSTVVGVTRGEEGTVRNPAPGELR